MRILVFNVGSSSIKFQIFNNGECETKGMVDSIGENSTFIINNETQEKLINNHEEGLNLILDNIDTDNIDAVGHRVVHGGEHYKESCIINDEVIQNIRKLEKLAPLHNPYNLKGIEKVKEKIPDVKQVAVFDTSFHQSIPKENYIYGIPYEYYQSHGVRKYGFHGISYQYITEKVREINGKPQNLIICHLGNGASMCAVKEGKSIETSMGLTPVDGLLMGTRSGHIDPGLIDFFGRQGMSCEEMNRMLNKKSGFLGLCGERDMREIHNKSEENDKYKLVIDKFVNDIVKYFGSYHALLGNVYALVFTAGIGEGAFYIREKVCEKLQHLGIKLDKEKNNNNEMTVSTEDSKIKVMVVPTNEEYMINKETERLVTK